MSDGNDLLLTPVGMLARRLYEKSYQEYRENGRGRVFLSLYELSDELATIAREGAPRRGSGA